MEDLHLPDKTKIGFVHLRVKNLAKMLDFYHDALSLEARLPEEAAGEEPAAYLSGCDNDTPFLILSEDQDAQIRSYPTTGLYHIAIRFPSRRDLARALRGLASHRYQLGGLADHGVSQALYLDDPEGNGVELYVDRPQPEWPRQGDRVAMVSEAFDLQDLANEAPAETEPCAPAGTDMGHVHLQVSNLSQSRRFYEGKLGFDVMQENYPGALFVSAGGYHHHVGMNVWESRGAPPPPEEATGLVDFGIQLPDRASWQRLVERLQAEGMHVSPTRSLDGWEGVRVSDPDQIGVDLVYHDQQTPTI